MLNQGEQQTTIITYHGSGRVSTAQVPKTEEADLDLTLTPEEEQEDPLYAAIVNHVVRQVRNAGH